MIRGYFLAFGEEVAPTQVALVDGGPRGSCRSPSACRCADRARSDSRTWVDGRQRSRRLLLRVALLDFAAYVLFLELASHCALTLLLLLLTSSELVLGSLHGVVLDRGDLFQVDRLGRELHSEELALLSDDAQHPAVTERQAVAALVLLA